MSRDEAENIVRAVLPPLDPAAVFTELTEADAPDRTVKVHAVIRRCAEENAPASVWMTLRDGLAERRWMTKADFMGAYREYSRAVGAAREQARRAAHATETTGSIYQAGDDGCLYQQRPDGEPRMIAAFVPRVVADVERDDGADRTRMFRIRVTLPTGQIGEIDVPPAKLGDPVDWAARAAGVRAVVLAVLGAREHVRAAAQLLAPENLETRTIYVHTGWRQIGGVWLYLSAAGGLGAAGVAETVMVDLPGKLASYALPDPAGRDLEEIRAAVQASLAILDVAPDAVTVPVLASAYRAPLLLPPDGSVFLAGRTGEGKSQLTALAQQHFGPAMDGQHLPGSWGSTGNSLAELAFLLAGTLFTVDDYVPTGSSADVAKLRRTAEQLLRGAANGAGRDRLDATATLRAARPPRAQILATGEDIPPGQSLRGRMFIVELAKGTLNWQTLGMHQQRGADGTYALAMAGYVRWLAGHLDGGKLTAAGLGDERVKLRAKATGTGQHRRTPDMIASLALGWQTWLDYAADLEAITHDQRDGYARRVWAALVAGADEQADGQRQVDPVQVLLDTLSSAISSGAAHLSALDGAPPSRAGAWGWETVHVGEDIRERGRGERIGWVDGEHVYLDPHAAYTAAVRRATLAGLPALPTEPTLRKRLDEAGKLASVDLSGGKRRLTVRKVVDGERRVQVLHLHASTLGVGGE